MPKILSDVFVKYMTTLLSYASPWQTGDSKNTTRKRISSMNLPEPDTRKTQRKMPDMKDEQDTIEDTQEYQNTRAEHIHTVLNKMTSVHVDEGGLENFSQPLQFSPESKPFSDSSDKIVDIARKNMSNPNPFIQPYSSLGNSYKDSYNKEGKTDTKTDTKTDNKMSEKMNYMIYLLEQQQHEETNHVTEEFILYTLLGVFIIYIVDSFSRTGKYVR